MRRMFQSPIVPGEVTVRQAMEYAMRYGAQERQLSSDAWSLIGEANINADRKISNLSYGQRRLVELCMALQAQRAALLDEPFAGMAPRLVHQASKVIGKAADKGLSILVIDHYEHLAANFPYHAEHRWAAPNDPHSPTGLNDPSPDSVSRQVVKTRDNPGATWRIRHLRIGDKTALQGCSIRLMPSEFIVLSGDNGTGKSTVLRALAGVEQPWNGVNSDMDSTPQNLSIHLSPQPPKLLPDIKVLDNLRCMLGDGAQSNYRLARARELLNWMGFSFDALGSRWAADLSGGEAALVALVGAAVSAQPLVLLDEPFEGLSMQVLPLAYRLLALTLSNGKSAIITSHDKQLLERVRPTSRISLEKNNNVSMDIIGVSFESMLSGGEVM